MTAMNPVWRRAPLVLMRFPGLLASVMVGALLLAAAIAAPTLYLASIRESALQREVAKVTSFGAGLDFVINSRFRSPFDEGSGRLYDRVDRALKARFDPKPYVNDGIFTIMAAPLPVAPLNALDRERRVRLVYRDGVADHLQQLAGGAIGDGIWLASADAEEMGVEVGDRIAVGFEGRTTPVEVTGIYKELYNLPESTYWRNYTEEIFPEPFTTLPPPPTFAFGARSTVTSLERSIGESSAEFRWQFPLRVDPPPTFAQVERVDRLSEIVTKELNDPDSKLMRAMECTPRCFGYRGAGYSTGGFSTLLPSVLQQTRARVAGLTGPAQLLSTAGILVALAVVAAAGAFTVASRRVEAAFLFARGMSPRTVASKTVLESLIPVALGAAAGAGLAILLVKAVGPSARIEQDALVSGLRGAALAIPLGLVCIGLVAMASYSRHSTMHESGARRSIPYEPVLLAGAVFCFVEIARGHGLVSVGEGISRPSVYLLLFPILFLAGAGGMATKALWIPLRSMRDRGGMKSPASYLALHRLAGAKWLAILLVSACALALGIFVFSQTIVESFDASVNSKAGIFVGSDVQALVTYEREVPEGFPFAATKVTKMPESARLGPRGPQVDVLAVDPATIAHAIYWDKSFGGSIQEVADDLAAEKGGSIPAVIAGGAEPTPELDYGEGAATVRLDVVAQVSSFPGMSSAHPLVVVPKEALDSAIADQSGPNPLREAGASNELWIKGPDDEVVAALERSVHPYDIFTVGEVKEHPTIETVTRTFGFLQAIGLGAAILVVAGILMYLQARQRARIVSYSLARRMGLTQREHRVALVLEIGSMLLGALALAVLLSVVAGWLVHTEVDPLPRLAGDSLFRMPTSSSIAAAVILSAVSTVGGIAASRIAERSNVARVMRLAE